MKKPSEENTEIIDKLVKELIQKPMTIDEIKEFTGWVSYRSIIQHIDGIGDNYPIFSPAKNQYKILTDSDYVTYA